MSYRLEHPGLDFLPLASGELFCIVPAGHELAGCKQVSAAEIIRYPLIGIDPNDPYGRIMAEIFARNKLAYDITIRARFGTTVCALVKAGLGIAVIDQFTVAHGGYPGVELLRIVEPTRFDTYIAVKRGAPLSLHIEHFIECLRSEMRGGGTGQGGAAKARSKPAGIARARNNMMLSIRHKWVIVLGRQNAIVWADRGVSRTDRRATRIAPMTRS